MCVRHRSAWIRNFCAVLNRSPPITSFLFLKIFCDDLLHKIIIIPFLCLFLYLSPTHRVWFMFQSELFCFLWCCFWPTWRQGLLSLFRCFLFASISILFRLKFIHLLKYSYTCFAILFAMLRLLVLYYVTIISRIILKRLFPLPSWILTDLFLFVISSNRQLYFGMGFIWH